MTNVSESKRRKYGLSGPANEANLMKWAELMVEWAKDARDDIIRLEAATGIPMGDPGDPPSWPPE